MGVIGMGLPSTRRARAPQLAVPRAGVYALQRLCRASVRGWRQRQRTEGARTSSQCPRSTDDPVPWLAVVVALNAGRLLSTPLHVDRSQFPAHLRLARRASGLNSPPAHTHTFDAALLNAVDSPRPPRGRSARCAPRLALKTRAGRGSMSLQGQRQMGRIDASPLRSRLHARPALRAPYAAPSQPTAPSTPPDARPRASLPPPLRRLDLVWVSLVRHPRGLSLPPGTS
ncbi:hypothetical protein B0H14DRAFT_3584495 [Mycena olivaceomarginata]|nr:hypothetical protein B0H14DRAFT_3584495 [Mycena olivaceomarginata]